MAVIFERDVGNGYTLVGEVEATYNGSTGERHDLRLFIKRVGPRGGRTTLWSGTPADARRRVDDLFTLIEAARKTPDRIERLANG